MTDWDELNEQVNRWISKEEEPVRTFETGATRDTETDKFDYEGFLSPAVLQEFARYMHKHRHQSDGTLRASDNWQKGMPRDVYMKSLCRHFMDVWMLHRNIAPERLVSTMPDAAQHDMLVEALAAMLFNVQGYFLELLAGR